MRSVVLSSARLQFHSMVRSQLLWTGCAALVWLLVVRLQEPAFAARFRVPFFEPSARCGALVLGLLLGPLAAESGTGSWTQLRSWSRRPLAVLGGLWLGGTLYACLLSALYVLLSVAITSAMSGHMYTLAEMAPAGLAVLLGGATSLALAPAVAACTRGLVARALAWGGLFATSSGVLGFSAPIPISILWRLPTADAGVLVPVGAALLAAFCLAVAAFGRKTPASP